LAGWACRGLPAWVTPGASYALRFAKSAPDTTHTGDKERTSLPTGTPSAPALQQLGGGRGWVGADFAKRSAYEARTHPLPTRAHYIHHLVAQHGNPNTQRSQTP